MVAERSYPESEVRGGQEKTPCIQDQGQKPGRPHARRTAAKRSYSASEVRGGGREEPPRARGQGRGREEQPHVQGAVAGQAQEGLEEPSHVEDQEGRW